MDEINGQFGGMKRFELLMDSGEYVRVQPLSIYLVRALRDKAEELFPFPDKTQYEKALDDAKAIEPGQVIPAEDNPEYQKLYDDAAAKQTQYTNDHCIALSVEPLQGREVMIAKYRDRVTQLRAIMTLPEDDWDATLRFCIMTSRDDFNKVTSAIMGNALPREECIVDSMRIFRCYVRQKAADGDHPEEKPQGAAADQPAESQSDHGTVQSGTGVGVANTEPDDSGSQSGRTQRNAGTRKAA